MAPNLTPFIDELPETSSDFGYMQYTGVGTVGTFQSVTLEKALYNRACGYFSNGFTREAAPDPFEPFLDDPDIFVPCLRDPQKLQIKARSLQEVRELAEKKNIPMLVPHASFGHMQEPDIRTDVIAHVPALEALFNKWQNSSGISFSEFSLNAVGIAIGHALQRNVNGDYAPLDVFLL